MEGEKGAPTMRSLRINMLLNVIAFALGVAMVVIAAFVDNPSTETLATLGGFAIVALALAAFGK
jgi:uncharacterized transporter YbjL